MEKKLIYILNQYSDNSAQHFYHVINLLQKMAERNVKIVLIIEKSNGIPKVMNPNIKVVTQKETNKIKRIMELKKILKKYIVQGYNKIFIRISLGAAVIAIKEGKKYGAEVYYWQSGDNLTYDRKKKGIDKLKYKVTNESLLMYIKNNVDHFVTGPETMVEFYKKELNIKPEKMTLLYNDIDTSRFVVCSEEEKKELKKSVGIDENKKIVLFVHRLTPMKRFYMQLPYVVEKEEFRKLNALLVIVGNGPDYKRIKEQVEKSKFKDLVKMIGEIPNKQIMDYYKMADVFINPSYSEGFPRVVIESMACGLPVVATDVGGTKDIVGQKQKEFIFDKDNIDGFRNGVLKILDNNELREKLIKENLEKVKSYSTEKVADMYIQTIFAEY